MELNVKAAVSPRTLATSLRRDLKNPKYIAEIERSRKDLFADRVHDWQHVLDGEASPA